MAILSLVKRGSVGALIRWIPTVRIPTVKSKWLVLVRDRRHNTGPSLFARGDFHNFIKKAGCCFCCFCCSSRQFQIWVGCSWLAWCIARFATISNSHRLLIFFVFYIEKNTPCYAHFISICESVARQINWLPSRKRSFYHSKTIQKPFKNPYNMLMTVWVMTLW